MRTFLILALAAFFSTQMACKQGGTQTEHGFRFINHTDKGGQKPQPGETVLFHLEAFIGDSMMGSTRKNFAAPREFTLPTADKLPKRVPAVYDALLLSGVGDSVTITGTNFGANAVDNTVKVNGVTVAVQQASATCSCTAATSV